MLRVTPEIYALSASGELGDLKKALQFAVELEHSTMPPYLYARYSLGTSLANFEIARTLKKTVWEEMHHMLLAGNLLKAIGGSPVIDSPAFVPSYPTHLPGTVAAELEVPLAPFSLTVAEDIFMRIEQPKRILDFDVTGHLEALPARTIGEFYGRIRETFEACGDRLIVDKTGDTQPTHFGLPPGLQKVTSAADAVAAIDLIVEQGEGTATQPTFPDDDDDSSNDDVAHYYKFAEMVRGRLKKNPKATPQSPPEDQYIYDSSDPVPFKQEEVLLLRTNPKSAHFPSGSAARLAIEGFNRTYTDVLRQLHASFNGAPERILDAVDAMNTMGQRAQAIITIELDDGTRPGPTFEYFTE
jgi:Ferritin-like